MNHPQSIVDAVMARWRDGESYLTIAREMGFASRNVACGIIRRYERRHGMSIRSAKPRPPRVVAPRVRSLPSRAAAPAVPVQAKPREPKVIAVRQVPPPQKPMEPPMPPPVARGSVRFIDRGIYQCAWVLPERDAEQLAMCCGAPVAPGGSWCAEHRLKVFVPVEGRRHAERSMAFAANRIGGKVAIPMILSSN